MKKKKIVYITSLWVLLSLISCSEVTDIETVDEVTPSDSPYPCGVELTVKASLGDGSESRTVVVDTTKIYWTKDDAINLFYGTGSAGKFTAVNITDPTSYAEFNGTLSVVTGYNETGTGYKSFWGVYPYNPANTCDGSSVTLTIPSVQESAHGSFANNLNPTVSKSPGLDLMFYNVGSWFIFSVTQTGITSATLRGNNNEDLVGKVNVTMDSDDRPACTVLEGGKSITMEAPEGGFVPGTLYYMVLIPQVLEQGYTLTLFKDDASADCVVSKSAEFKRSYYRRKKNADNGLVFNGIINFQDPAVKAICVANWDTDGDGELSYAEAAAVTTIPYGVFNDNREISYFDEFQYFTGVTSINHAVFEGCTGLITITIPNNVTSIGDTNYSNSFPGHGAFSNCTSLASVNIPEGVTNIGYYAFLGCSMLNNIVLPEGLTTIGKDAFSGCSSIEEISLPSTLTDCYEAFNQSGIKKVVCYLDLVNRVGSYNIQSGAHSLSKLALGFIKVKEGATMLENSRPNVTEIIVRKPSTTTTYSLGNYAFCGFTGLTTLSLPDGMTSIGSYAFQYCESLEEIPFQSEVTSIGSGAFEGCTGLTSVTIPDKVTEIYKYTFNGCTGLTSVTIPEGVTYIGPYAFNGCTGLTSITIPEGVTCIRERIFKDCSKLTSIIIPDGVTSIEDAAFYGCSSLTSVIVPSTVTSIGKNAFGGCSKLTSIIIPDGVTSIEIAAFEDCSSLTSVIVPSAVTSIGRLAFAGCSSLTEIIVKPDIPPTGEWHMLHGTNNCPIYVPAGSVDAYKSAEIWNEYADRIQCDPSQAVHLEGVSLSPTLAMAKGFTATLTPTFTPSNATDKSVNWSSSDESVVTVASDGTLTAVENGTATVTVTTRDGGFTASCTVTVKKTFPEGNTFDEDAYITYVANEKMYFSGDDQYFMVSTFPCDVTGNRIEMKFQMDRTSTASLSSSVLVDGFLEMNDYNLYWGSYTSGLSDKCIVQFGGDVALSDVLTLTATLEGRTLSTEVNGVSKSFDGTDHWASTNPSIRFDHLFHSYERDHDEGTTYDYSAGVPDGARLYYVKIWDASGNLVYFGHAAKAVNPSNAQEEYCWYSLQDGVVTHTFAYNNGSTRQPFGGGID